VRSFLFYSHRMEGRAIGHSSNHRMEIVRQFLPSALLTALDEGFEVILPLANIGRWL
jgi:hypothetical protein